MIINLLLINLIVVMVFLSGFWTSMDDFVYSRLKPYHLPHIFKCCFCQAFWLSLLYIIIAGKFTLLTIALCLINAHLSDILIPLITIIKNWLYKITEWLMPR